MLNFASKFIRTQSNRPLIIKDAHIQKENGNYKLKYLNGISHILSRDRIEVDSSLFVQLMCKYENGSIHNRIVELIIGDGHLFATEKTPYLSVEDPIVFNALQYCEHIPKGIWLYDTGYGYLSITNSGYKLASFEDWKKIYSDELKYAIRFRISRGMVPCNMSSLMRSNEIDMIKFWKRSHEEILKPALESQEIGLHYFSKN